MIIHIYVCILTICIICWPSGKSGVDYMFALLHQTSNGDYSQRKYQACYTQSFFYIIFFFIFLIFLIPGQRGKHCSWSYLSIYTTRCIESHFTRKYLFDYITLRSLIKLPAILFFKGTSGTKCNFGYLSVKQVDYEGAYVPKN